MSTSDIVVLHQAGEDHAFYVDSFGFTEVPEFLHTAHDGKELAIGMSDCQIDGRPGLWLAAEEMWIDDRLFLLMQSQEFGAKAARQETS